MLFTTDFSIDEKYLVWNNLFTAAHCRGILQIQRLQMGRMETIFNENWDRYLKVNLVTVIVVNMRT